MCCADIFSHIVAYSEPCVTSTYSELCHSISWYIQNAVQLWHVENSAIFRNFAIFRILAYIGPDAYSEPHLFRHIQANSDIFKWYL